MGEDTYAAFAQRTGISHGAKAKQEASDRACARREAPSNQLGTIDRSVGRQRIAQRIDAHSKEI